MINKHRNKNILYLTFKSNGDLFSNLELISFANLGKIHIAKKDNINKIVLLTKIIL